MGLSARVPHRVDAATKAALLGLIDGAVEAGWTTRRACRVLDLGEVRAHRWQARRACGKLVDHAPGGSPMHAILAQEAARCWRCSMSGARSSGPSANWPTGVLPGPGVGLALDRAEGVAHEAHLHFRARPRPGKSKRRPFPAWAEYTPNSIWIYDTTHFTRAGMAVLIIEDLVSRKWITHVVSVEETSTQVEVAFTDALQAEGLLETVDARHDDSHLDLAVDEQTRPILLAVSDTAPKLRRAPPESSWPYARSPNTSAGPAPQPTRPGSKA